MGVTRVLVISTGGPQCGPQWRNLLKNRFLDSARNDTHFEGLMLRSEIYAIEPLF